MSTLFINGKWMEPTIEQFSSINPADETVVGTSCVANEVVVEEAIESAHKQFQSWKNTTYNERATYIEAIIVQLEKSKETLAEMMTLEMGKTYKESCAEVDVIISYATYVLGEAKREQGTILPSSAHNRTIEVVREPIGVIGCITPWNFPVVLAAYKIFAALIAGNTIVWKPASEVALSAKIFTQAIERAQLPAGVFHLVTGSGSKIGNQIVAHEKVAAIAFTGSTNVGKHIARLGSETLKRVSLELGGKNAVIVLEDADLDKATEGIIQSAYATSGQRCTAASRVIVHHKVKAALMDILLKKVAVLKVGNGLDASVDMGPLVNKTQLTNVQESVAQALGEGGVLEYGGARIGETGYFYQPTIISNVTAEATLAQEEVFGPVLAIIEVEDVEEAIRVNNNTVYGLSTSVYTNNLSHAKHVSKEAASGLVYINSGTSNAEIGVAFGGTKLSGNGHREVSVQSFDFMTEWKSIYTNY